jgi:hypothetical protein
MVTVGEAATVIVTALEAGDVTGTEALSVTLQVIEAEVPAAVYEYVELSVPTIPAPTYH